MPKVFSREQPEKPAAAGRMHRELEIDKCRIAVRRHQPVRFLCQVVMRDPMPVQLAQQVGSGFEIARVAWPRHLHRLPGEPASAKRVAPVTYQSRYALQIVEDQKRGCFP